MAPTPTPQQLAAEFQNRGAFEAINYYVDSGVISKETASAWTARIFSLFLDKTREAQREARQIGPVLQRLEHACAVGARPHPYNPVDPKVLSLGHEVTIFDNWVMSLYETDLTMIGYAAPERARAKPLEMAKSMEAVWRKRLQQMDFALNAPELFTRG